MAKNQATRERNVKNVKKFLGSLNMSCRYQIQQFLEWFNVDRKLERITWSMLKKSEISRQRQAEDLYREKERELEAKAEGKPFYPDKRKVNEPGELPFVVGFCPDCNSVMRGHPISMCSKTGARHGQVVFYKECTACKYFAEIWRKRNKYIEIEKGGM